MTTHVAYKKLLNKIQMVDETNKIPKSNNLSIVLFPILTQLDILLLLACIKMKCLITYILHYDLQLHIQS
jgi:hypothetical protein